MSTLKMRGGKLSMNDGKLTCVCCCPTVLPTITWRSRSASKSKCGFTEFGTPSTPPRIYLKRERKRASAVTRVGKDLWVFGNGAFRLFHISFSNVWSRSCITEYDPSHCSTSDTTEEYLPVIAGAEGTYAYEYEGDVCTAELHETLQGTSDVSFFVAACGTINCGSLTIVSPTLAQTVSEGDNDYRYGPNTLADACTPGGEDNFDYAVKQHVVTTVSCELSVEYTTADLIEATRTALPNDWPNTTAGTLRSLASNELTYSEREAEWRVTAPADLVAGRTYRLYYFVRFTPASGPAVDGAEQYVEIDGADAGDPIAWQSIDVPAANGTNTIVLLRWECPTTP